MDSSRKESVIPRNVAIDGFSPWQVARLRDRLANYKSAVRHGWEAVAIDILNDGDQDPDYVDAEEIRPYSESLRRFIPGPQIPSTKRLIALGVFLANQGYLGPGELDDNVDQRHVPLAFHEFIAGDDGDARQALNQLRMYEGSYSHIIDSGPLSPNEYQHYRLVLNFEGGAITAKMGDSYLNKIDTMRRLKRDAAARKRALRHELLHTGFALGMPNGRMVTFLKPAAYDEFYQSKVLLLWAVPESDEASPVSSLLLMDYPSASKVEDVNEAREKLADPEALITLPLYRPDFLVFDRD